MTNPESFVARLRDGLSIAWDSATKDSAYWFEKAVDWFGIALIVVVALAVTALLAAGVVAAWTAVV